MCAVALGTGSHRFFTRRRLCHSVEFRLIMVVEEVCLAGIDRRDWLTGFLQVRATLLTEMFFEKNGVAGVGSENGIQNITGKWYEADDEIESDVHEHLDLQSHGET